MKHILPIFLFLLVPCLCWAETRFQNFNTDPNWDGFNNFNTTISPRPVTQDFDYSPATTFCNATPGEVGGTVCPDGQPAYYAKAITPVDFESGFSASGTMYVGPGGGHTLVGFFNSGTINEWRTANSVAIRIYGRGNTFQVYFEYGTSLWRAGGGNMTPIDFLSGAAYSWSLTYTPVGLTDGQLDVMFGGFNATMNMDPMHRSDGASMNRFGILNVVKHPDDPGTLWIDNVNINGNLEDFSVDPGWDELGNHAAYPSLDTRPKFAFGYGATQFVNGTAGEIGGRLFRGDIRLTDTMAYYGDIIADLSLESPLEASGKINLRRAVSDSTILFGFFNSTESVLQDPGDSQNESLPKEFLGFAIEGPSAEGHYIYPCYRTTIDSGDRNDIIGSNIYIYPNAQTGAWAFDYNPEGNGGGGEITLSYEGQTVLLPLLPGHKAMGANFDRFGFVTTWIDGNGQLIYMDDLTYTFDVPTTAAFSGAPTEGVFPLDVTFTDESSSKYTITDWAWDFGDGSPISNVRNPLHTYATDGAYTVKLTITTATDSDTFTRQWYVDVGNTLPGPGLALLGGLAVVMAGYAGIRMRKR